jgi:hypothetical protein
VSCKYAGMVVDGHCECDGLFDGVNREYDSNVW